MGSKPALVPGAPGPSAPKAGAPKPWNTLERLRGNLYLLLACDALFLMALMGAYHVHLQRLQTIGRDSAPSIIAAQHIKSAVAAMEAEAADDMLGRPAKGVGIGADYIQERDEAAKALIAAAENIAFGDAERAPIEDLQVGLADYESLLQFAMDLHQRGDASAMDVYRQAARVADEKLFPATEELDKANRDAMNNAYDEATSQDSVVRLSSMVAGFLLLFSLIYVQGFISEKTRRTLNLPLVLATLVSFGYLAFAYRALTAEAHSLKIAREDAFRSINALWQARADAYVARADLGRSLFGGPNAEGDRTAFQEEANRVASVSGGQTFSEAALKATDNHRVDGLTGYLADELRNITFYGELEAAQETLRDWGDFASVGNHVIDLQQAGKTPEAIALCTGPGPNEANGAFHRFDAALGQTLEINRRAFDQAIQTGFAALSEFPMIASAAAAIIACLCIFGVWQRLREYL